MRLDQRVLLAVVVASGAVANAAGIQQPSGGNAEPPATALVLGRVVDAVTNRPIPDAIINLSAAQTLARDLISLGLPQPVPSQRVVADGEGRFVLRNLAGGSYRFNVSAPGYISGQFGQLRPQSAPQLFVLAPDQKAGDVVIRLWRSSTISGRVVDEAGEPVVGVRVDLLRRSRTDGQWLPNVYASARTDDHGMYRITGNLPSLYYVMVPAWITSVPQSAVGAAAEMRSVGVANVEDAQGLLLVARAGGGGSMQAGDSLLQLTSPEAFALPPTVSADGKVMGYPTTFYPGTLTSARATAITIEAGEDRTGVDIQVRPVPMVRVSGIVLGPSGPMPNQPVRLVSGEVDLVGGGAGVFQTAATVTDGSGAFVFVAVPPGQFALQTARGGDSTPVVMTAGGEAPNAPRPALWAEVPLAVSDNDIADLALRMREGTTVSGRIVFEGRSAGAPPPAGLDQAAERAQQLGNLGLASPLQVQQAIVQAQAVVFTLTPVSGRAPSIAPPARADASGDFRAQGYVPGRYYPNVTNVPGWHLKSITAGGRDVLRAPLTIATEPIDDVVVTFTERESSIEGRVATRTGAIDPDATVLVFPADYRAMAAGVNPRVVRLARPAPQTGVFSLPSVVPGDYLVAAVPDNDLPNWRDLTAISALAEFATRVTVVAGQRAVVTVTRGDLP